MTRVSENSSQLAINYAVGKTKSRLEDLQLKGSTLKRIAKPSDDPLANIDVMVKKSQSIDADQYLRNLSFTQTNLGFTETILEELTNILVKAKELAIGQSSDIYNKDVRQSVAKEVGQLRLQALSLANKRIGNRYLFSGQKVLTKPFDSHGNYKGDDQKINIEINKDVFVPINMTGAEIFFDQKRTTTKPVSDLTPENKTEPTDQELLENSIDRQIASETPKPIKEDKLIHSSIFNELKALEDALMTNNPEITQDLLEKIDNSTERVISLRTEVGALYNTVANSKINIEKMKLLNEEHRSKLEDADVAELFSDLQKQQNVLKATYQASSKLMNESLMDFLR